MTLLKKLSPFSPVLSLHPVAAAAAAAAVAVAAAAVVASVAVRSILTAGFSITSHCEQKRVKPSQLPTNLFTTLKLQNLTQLQQIGRFPDYEAQ